MQFCTYAKPICIFLEKEIIDLQSNSSASCTKIKRKNKSENDFTLPFGVVKLPT
jgi:hypothetical protein